MILRVYGNTNGVTGTKNLLKVIFTEDALKELEELNRDHSQARVLKDVIKALHFMQENLRHPSLNTHEYHGTKGPDGQKLFEAYVEQHTPHAYRIFWYYGDQKESIVVTAIIPHPRSKG